MKKRNLFVLFFSLLSSCSFLKPNDSSLITNTSSNYTTNTTTQNTTLTSSVEIIDNTLKYELSKTGDYYIVVGSNDKEITEIKIPAKYKDKDVKEIGIKAFENNSKLNVITFEENIKLNNIDEYAFSGCSSLKSIVIPNGIISIEKGAFKGCDSLESIIIPFIGENKDSNQFLGYIFGANSYMENSSYVPSSLKEVIVLEECTSIGDYAFYECSFLTSITIPDSVTSIGEGAFYECSSLKYNEYDNSLYLGNEENLYLVLV